MHQKNILVSILINNYNNELFIKRCVQSCLNQSYKNIEIIIYDDLSNDKSKKYIKNIKSKRVKKIFNKKKYFKTGRLNQLNAIKRSFIRSKGEIIFLLDTYLLMAGQCRVFYSLYFNCVSGKIKKLVLKNKLSFRITRF